MKHDLLILESDREYAKKRIAELDAQILALGPEFNDAFTQTSESWHDNAPFEVVRDKQTLLAAERHKLKEILNNSLPNVPKQKTDTVGIGSRVTVVENENGKTTSYFIAGDWTYRAGEKENGAIIISRVSPIASIIMGKKVGDEVEFKNKLIIQSIKY